MCLSLCRNKDGEFGQPVLKERAAAGYNGGGMTMENEEGKYGASQRRNDRSGQAERS